MLLNICFSTKYFHTVFFSLFCLFTWPDAWDRLAIKEYDWLADMIFQNIDLKMQNEGNFINDIAV